MHIKFEEYFLRTTRNNESDFILSSDDMSEIATAVWSHFPEGPEQVDRLGADFAESTDIVTGDYKQRISYVDAKMLNHSTHLYPEFANSGMAEGATSLAVSRRDFGTSVDSISLGRHIISRINQLRVPQALDYMGKYLTTSPNVLSYY